MLGHLHKLCAHKVVLQKADLSVWPLQKKKTQFDAKIRVYKRYCFFTHSTKIVYFL
jgi:hypothetical protein